jgi:hypothetical protein
MRKIGERVHVVTEDSDAASIICFLNTWAKEQYKHSGAQPPAESRKLWDYLTALRGPDVAGAMPLKEKTTERIRVPLSDLCYGLATVRGMYTSEPFSLPYYLMPPPGSAFLHNHFMDHILRANTAILEMFPREDQTDA